MTLDPKRPRWFHTTALVFDTETTAPDPLEARLVSATAATVGLAGLTDQRDWLINPGVEIPEEASKIHGITTAMAVEKGIPVFEAAAGIALTLEIAWGRGLPMIAMNANYDLTVLMMELRRAGRAPPAIGMVIDPFVIDRACDPYRKGKRTLTALCEHYGVKLDGAHDAAFDALAAGRLVWRLGAIASGAIKVKGDKRVAARFAEIGKLNLLELQFWQKEAHRARQEDYSRYLVEQGKPAKVELGWPLRELPPEPEPMRGKYGPNDPPWSSAGWQPE